MKKRLLFLLTMLFSAVFALALAACGSRETAYSVETYLESLDGTSFERGETLEGRAKKGENLTLTAPEIEGFEPVEHEGTVADGTVGKDTFRFYYARKSYTVTFDKNQPAGLNTVGGAESSVRKYGETVYLPAPDTFRTEGALFAGYALSPEGELLNGNFTVKGETTVYAVWNRALRNRLGGDDVLYVLHEAPGTVRLDRGGLTFYGSLEGNMFSFSTADGKPHAGTAGAASFCYATEAEAKEYSLLSTEMADGSVQTVKNEDVVLFVDEFFGATLTENGETVNGEIALTDGFASLVTEPSAEASFPEYAFYAENGAELFRFYLTEKDGPVFVRRGEEAGYGVGLRNSIVGTYESSFDYSLDGYGGIRLYYNGIGTNFIGSYAVEGYYTAEREGVRYRDYVISARIDLGEEFTDVRFYTVPAAYAPGVEFSSTVTGDGQPIRALYEEMYGTSGKWTSTGAGTLVLDGFGVFPDSATLTDAYGNLVYRGPYEVTSSAVIGGGTVVVTIPAEEGTGRANRVFRLDDTSRKRFSEYGGTALSGLEYAMMDGTDYGIGLHSYYLIPSSSGFGSTMTLYERTGGDDYERVTTGNLQSHVYGDLYMYTFSSAERTFLFMTSVLGIEERTSYTLPLTEFLPVFFILEEDGVKHYEVWNETDGDGVIWFNDKIDLLVWFPEGAEEGKRGFDCSGTFHDETKAAGDPFGGYASFTETDFEKGTRTEKRIVRSGNNFALTERIFLYDAEGAEVIGNEEKLVLNGAGDARLRVGNSWVTGSYTVRDDETYGKLYSLDCGDTEGGTFEFAICEEAYFDPAAYDTEILPVIRRFDDRLKKTFTGAALTLDGVRSGSYLGVRGTYLAEEEGAVVRFTSEDGKRYAFSVDPDKGEAILLDGAYGTYSCGGETFSFDGNKGFTCGGKSGSYELNLLNDGRTVVSLLYSDGETGLYVLSAGEALPYDPMLNGAFSGEDGSVLVGDGAGNFVLHTETGLVLTGTAESYGNGQAAVDFGGTVRSVTVLNGTYSFS